MSARPGPASSGGPVTVGGLRTSAPTPYHHKTNCVNLYREESVSTAVARHRAHRYEDIVKTATRTSEIAQ
jgi:hypothetical protein